MCNREPSSEKIKCFPVKISMHNKLLRQMRNVSVHESIPSRNFYTTTLRKPFIFDLYLIKFNEMCSGKLISKPYLV